MAEGIRPGGLTALAILNFVIGGLGVIASLLLVVGFALANLLSEGEAVSWLTERMNEGGGKAILVFLAVVLQVISYVLLIVAGIGYLKQKRLLGRIMGSAYGIIMLISIGLMLGLGKEFEFSSIRDLVYPVLTLIMVNFTFKEDLVY